MKKRTLTPQQDQQFQQRDFALAAWNAFLKKDTRRLQHILAVMTEDEQAALAVRAAQFYHLLSGEVPIEFDEEPQP